MERGESFIERLEYLDIAQIALVDGQIQTKNIQTPNTATETEDADPSISNEIMDMAEIILDMSDTIKTLYTFRARAYAILVKGGRYILTEADRTNEAQKVVPAEYMEMVAEYLLM